MSWHHFFVIQSIDTIIISPSSTHLSAHSNLLSALLFLMTSPFPWLLPCSFLVVIFYPLAFDLSQSMFFNFQLPYHRGLAFLLFTCPVVPSQPSTFHFNWPTPWYLLQATSSFKSAPCCSSTAQKTCFQFFISELSADSTHFWPSNKATWASFPPPWN